jgi:3-oxoacyl-[acyl-carrier protein] reductase
MAERGLRFADGNDLRGRVAVVTGASRRRGIGAAVCRALAAGVAGLGITVNALDPGATDTGWMTEEIKRALLPRSPLGRLGQPEDAARLVAFLASDAAEWITGQIIHSRGGM